jgi:hypothetical protein
VNPGAFERKNKTQRAFCEKPGFSQKGQWILYMNSYVTRPRTTNGTGHRTVLYYSTLRLRTTVQVAVRGQAAVLVVGTHVTVIDRRIRQRSSSLDPRWPILGGKQNECLPFFHEDARHVCRAFVAVLDDFSWR